MDMKFWPPTIVTEAGNPYYVAVRNDRDAVITIIYAYPVNINDDKEEKK
jgi:hypothetical protein